MVHSAGRAPFRAAQYLFRMERIHMPKGLKAAVIFAAMIALPILADNLLNRRPDIRLFQSFPWSGVLLALVMILIAVFVIGWNSFWKFKDDIEGIQGNLKLAERELTKILADNWDQKGRIGKVRERAEWAAMANPAIFPTIFHILKDDERLRRPGAGAIEMEPTGAAHDASAFDDLASGAPGLLPGSLRQSR